MVPGFSGNYETNINRKRNFSLSSACSEDQYSVSIWYYFQLNSLNFQNRSSLFWKSSFISAFHLRLVMKQVGAFVRKHIDEDVVAATGLLLQLQTVWQQLAMSGMVIYSIRFCCLFAIKIFIFTITESFF